jgi:hypothetical protein
MTFLIHNFLCNICIYNVNVRLLRCFSQGWTVNKHIHITFSTNSRHSCLLFLVLGRAINSVIKTHIQECHQFVQCPYYMLPQHVLEFYKLYVQHVWNSASSSSSKNKCDVTLGVTANPTILFHTNQRKVLLNFAIQSWDIIFNELTWHFSMWFCSWGRYI